MNRTAYTVIKGQNYYQYNRKRIRIMGGILLIVLVLISVCFITKTVTAQRNTDRIKLVRTVEVQKGDTLWSIASDNMSDEYDSVNDYIKEIKESNGISGDQIHAGNYIVVPYYTDTNQ